ncbi:MspA family porin [Nocardia sp. NPDC004582]
MYGKGIRARSGRILGVTLAAAAGLCGFGPAAPAQADTFIPLPGGSITRQLADGTNLIVRITGESATISGSMGSTPVHRNVWTTGVASIDLDGPSASTATLKISPGYIVGCQVDISGITANNSGGETYSPDTSLQTLGTLGLNEQLGSGITLGPGQAVARLMLDLERPDDYGQESHKRYNKVPGPHTSVSWTDETFSVDGCGGYAQARAFVAAEVDTATFIGNLVLYGEPFTIG